MYPSRQNPAFGVFVKETLRGLESRGARAVKTVRRFSRGKVLSFFEYTVFYLKCLRDGLVRRYDLIYIHFVTRSAFPAALFKLLWRVPVVINFHGTDMYAHGFWKKVTKAAVWMADMIVVPSDSFASILGSRFPAASGKVFVSPSGGIPGYFRRQPEPDTCDPNDSIRIGFVSGLLFEKGWSFFLEALKLLKGISFSAVMVGNGPDSAAVKRSISEGNLPVAHLPAMPREDLAAYYNRFDLLVFPSLRESLGLVGVEAMACGVPVIGSKIDGICDYLRDGYNGFAVEPGDPVAIAGAIRRFAALSTCEREEMSIAAERTAAKYRTDTAIETLYDELGDLKGRRLN